MSHPVILSLHDSLLFFCKQTTAYEMRISDWSSDVCSSDLIGHAAFVPRADRRRRFELVPALDDVLRRRFAEDETFEQRIRREAIRSEEHTSELQSLMRISYAVFCLKKKKQQEHLPRLRHTKPMCYFSIPTSSNHNTTDQHNVLHMLYH